MKIQDQVCTFDQARQLKALGVGFMEHITVFVYVNDLNADDTVDENSATLVTDEHAYENYRGWLYKNYRYAAFNVAELGVMLADPGEKPGGYTVGFRLGKWVIEKDGNIVSNNYDHEAHARAELLLIFIQERIFTVGTINTRLVLWRISKNPKAIVSWSTITTAQFLDLQPEAQREMIIDGLIHMKVQAAKLTTELNKLNGWIATLDISKADPEYIARFARLTKDLSVKIDDLTEQILIKAQSVRRITEQIQVKKLSDRLTKTPQL